MRYLGPLAFPFDFALDPLRSARAAAPVGVTRATRGRVRGHGLPGTARRSAAHGALASVCALGSAAVRGGRRFPGTHQRLRLRSRRPAGGRDRRRLLLGSRVGRGLRLGLDGKFLLGVAQRRALGVRDLPPAHALLLTHLEDRRDVLVGDSARKALSQRQRVVDLAVAELLVPKARDLRLLDVELVRELPLRVARMTEVAVVGNVDIRVLHIRVLHGGGVVDSLCATDARNTERQSEHQA